MDLKTRIRGIPDFPKKGILFYDITPLLADGAALRQVTKEFARYCKGKNVEVVTSIEARGFILGGALALELGIGFVPLRKPGKLPHETISATYEKEYGADKLEAHVDGIHPGQRVLIVDDLLATGGTCKAAIELV